MSSEASYSSLPTQPAGLALLPGDGALLDYSQALERQGDVAGSATPTFPDVLAVPMMMLYARQAMAVYQPPDSDPALESRLYHIWEKLDAAVQAAASGRSGS